MSKYSFLFIFSCFLWASEFNIFDNEETLTRAASKLPDRIAECVLLSDGYISLTPYEYGIIKNTTKSCAAYKIDHMFLGEKIQIHDDDIIIMDNSFVKDNKKRDKIGMFFELTSIRPETTLDGILSGKKNVFIKPIDLPELTKFKFYELSSSVFLDYNQESLLLIKRMFKLKEAGFDRFPHEIMYPISPTFELFSGSWDHKCLISWIPTVCGVFNDGIITHPRPQQYEMLLNASIKSLQDNNVKKSNIGLTFLVHSLPWSKDSDLEKTIKSINEFFIKYENSDKNIIHTMSYMFKKAITYEQQILLVNNMKIYSENMDDQTKNNIIQMESLIIKRKSMK